jgi:quinol monooxygenase YgiN
MITTKTLALALISLALVPTQDPVPKYPENYKVLLENDEVRVLDFRLRKGATEEMHSHPAHVTYVLEGFKIRFTYPDGSTRIRETKAGDVLYSEPTTHSPLNIGETDAHGILVEMKRPAAEASATREPLTAITTIHGIEGKEEELKRHLLSLTAPTLAEPGAIAYDLYQSTMNPAEFVRIERWRDEAALEAHKMTPHLKASFEKRKAEGWTTEITLWKPVSR